eukprot:GFYU01013247.1.p1 GENE.GFYU01013247.1~~GFYU01013247.1.p1  ORF type:complete len:341 (-),score=42.83 GFYU01013247.1:9-1031(-)
MLQENQPAKQVSLVMPAILALTGATVAFLVMNQSLSDSLVLYGLACCVLVILSLILIFFTLATGYAVSPRPIWATFSKVGLWISAIGGFLMFLWSVSLYIVQADSLGDIGWNVPITCGFIASLLSFFNAYRVHQMNQFIYTYHFGYCEQKPSWFSMGGFVLVRNQEAGRNEGDKYKIVVYGPADSGKSAVAARWLRNEFKSDFKTNPHKVSLGVRSYMLKWYKHAYAEVWDLPSKPTVDLNRQYFSDCNGVLLVIGPDNVIDIPKHLEHIFAHAPPGTPLVLAINKGDMPSEKKKKPTDYVNGPTKRKFIAIYKISARDDDGVDECFSALLHKAFQINNA